MSLFFKKVDGSFKATFSQSMPLKIVHNDLLSHFVNIITISCFHSILGVHHGTHEPV